MKPRCFTWIVVIAITSSSCATWVCPIPGETILQARFEIRSGVIRYVVTICNDANVDTVHSPWRHLQVAADRVGAEFVVRARGATIVAETYPDEQPILDGAKLPIPGGQWGLITLGDVDRVVVRGFEVRNYSTASAKILIGICVSAALFANPKFVNTTTPDLQVQPTSPAHTGNSSNSMHSSVAGNTKQERQG
ncbi:MAG TPA: hypothetical protein VFN25_01150 [Dokdonella sp.]|uniref:hypothetical protein n=1 Tax=Dokdonella sp. TaxID=2291710 RepID=UPI002D7EDBFE|nr:hypothetical protein [Dokdonella sp.]HET9031488.1 hypothetical protein [Dokdonella sp.]